MRFLFTFVLIILVIFTHAQENSVPDSSVNIDWVQWVSEYPVQGIQKSSLSFFEQVSKFVFGEKNDFEIKKPNAILACGPLDYLVMDQGNGTLFSIENGEKSIPKILRKTKTKFPSLVGMCKIAPETILLSDSRLNTIYQLNLQNQSLDILNNKLQLEQPTGIAFSPNTKEIWVVETAAHQISILNEQGERIKRIGKRGSDPGEFNYPTSIWIDAQGYAYIIDAMNFRVQVFDQKAKLISVFGEAGDATGYFARPKGIATDSFGNIYITDALYHTVQIFDIKGNFLYNFGRQGREQGEFWMPSGIYIDANNFIYVADSYNSRIQLFQLNKLE